MKNKFLSFGFILLLSQSCTYFFWGIKDLGNNFAIVEADENDISIQYCFTGDCNRTGLYVIPSKVVEYNKNSNWIIAKSINENNTSFWIIDKKNFPTNDPDVSELIKRSVCGPLDSVSFFKQKKMEGINLELKKY